MGVAASNIFHLIFIQVPQDTLVNGRVTDVPPQPVEVPVVVDEVTKWITGVSIFQYHIETD